MWKRYINPLPFAHAQTGDQVRSPGTYTDWELNWWSFALQSDAQPTEPHSSGPNGPVLQETGEKEKSFWGFLNVQPERNGELFYGNCVYTYSLKLHLQFKIGWDVYERNHAFTWYFIVKLHNTVLWRFQTRCLKTSCIVFKKQILKNINGL